MKKSFIRVLTVVLAITILSACLTAGAELKLDAKSISVNTGIKINVDGKEFVPVDSAGVPVEVFLHNGTTYLPVRGISNLFGVGIEWDNETKSVYLGTREGADLPVLGGTADVAASPFAVESKTINVHTGVSIYYNDEYFQPVDSEGVAVEVFLYDGTTYLPVRAISTLMNAEIDWDQANKTVLLSAAKEEAPSVDYKAIVKAAEDVAKIYTDMDAVILPYYRYYLQVSAVLADYAGVIRDKYQAGIPGAEDEFYMFSAAYTAFDRQFGTQIEKAVDFYEFGKTLTKRVAEYGSDGVYTEEELETLTTNTEYLTSNQEYYSEYIMFCTPEEILGFVSSSLEYEVIELVSLVTLE